MSNNDKTINSQTNSETQESHCATPSEQINHLELEQQVIRVLRSIFDPEIPVNIYDLGLIYKLEVQPTGKFISG
jgi:hemin uptake protein HemP